MVIAATTARPLPDGFLNGTGRREYENVNTRLLAKIWVASVAATTDEEFARVVRARRQLHDRYAQISGRAAVVAMSEVGMEFVLEALPLQKGGDWTGAIDDGADCLTALVDRAAGVGSAGNATSLSPRLRAAEVQTPTKGVQETLRACA